MEVVGTTGAIRRANMQSSCYYQQTNTQLFTGRTDALLIAQPTESKSHCTNYMMNFKNPWNFNPSLMLSTEITRNGACGKVYHKPVSGPCERSPVHGHMLRHWQSAGNRCGLHPRRDDLWPRCSQTARRLDSTVTHNVHHDSWASVLLFTLRTFCADRFVQLNTT